MLQKTLHDMLGSLLSCLEGLIFRGFSEDFVLDLVWRLNGLEDLELVVRLHILRGWKVMGD